MWNEALSLLLVGTCCSGVLVVARWGASSLMALIGLFVVLMNLFVLKQVRLFGMEATTADALGIGAGLGLNLLREYGSPALARRAIWLSFVMAALTAALGWGVVAFEPSPYDQGHATVAGLFVPSLRILVASLVTFVICERLEVLLFGWLRKRWKGRYLGGRHVLSLVVSQTLDTFLFTWLGLSGLVEPLWEIALVSLAVKFLAIVISGPFMSLSKRLLKGPLHVAL